MAPVLSKPLVFVDDGERIEFPAGSPVEVVAPEVALAGDPHRRGLVLGALAERQRRFRPGVVVLLGGRVRVLSARLVGSSLNGTEATGGESSGLARNRGPPACGSFRKGGRPVRGGQMAQFSYAEAKNLGFLPSDRAATS